MFTKLRGDKMAFFWTVVRLYLGWQWLEAGWNKVTGDFDATGFLKGAIAKTTGDHLVQRWYGAFLDGFALPNVDLFNFLVPWGELFVGLGLIIGAFTTVALYAGAIMNLAFLLAGAVSINPILYTLAIILLAVSPGSFRYGVDYYLFPKLREFLKKDESVSA